MTKRQTIILILAPLVAAVCASGQTPTAEPVDPTSPAEPVLPLVERPTGPVDTCITSQCHTKIMGGQFLHGPTAQRQCDACHVDDDVYKHTYKLVVPKTELCTYCHIRSERSVVHKPVTDKECDKCHDPHGTDHPWQLLGEPSGSLCFPCHKPEEYAGGTHGGDQAAIVSACDVCHESHSSWMPTLLSTTQRELCLSCHRDLRARLELIGRSHTSALDGQCLDCHGAHITAHTGQLRESAPDLCYSCHEHDNIKTLVETAPVVHGALTEKQSCNACHVGHGSVVPGMLAAPEKELCLTCHDEPLRAKDGRLLTDMASLFKENPRHHGPIRDDDCRSCHNAHASKYPDLLIHEYPRSFYASFSVDSYALCFECHIENLVTAENGIGHTEFRHGERNLHFLHVNKETRGRACGTCHDVHASSGPFLIRRQVPFGPKEWEIEIDFSQLPNGGTCATGCHETQSYDRGPGPMPKAPQSGLKPDLIG